MASFELWVNAGKPKFGTIYVSKNSDKFKYKNAIKKSKASIESGISNELHDSLVYKNQFSSGKLGNLKCAHNLAIK